MVAGAEVCHQSIPVVLDAGPYRCGIQKIEEIAVTAAAAVAVAGVPTSPSPVFRGGGLEVVAVDVSRSGLDVGSPDAIPDATLDKPVLQFVPVIRSGSFSDIGCRSIMEDEHICIDDLSSHLGSMVRCPKPSAFYGVFDGHGGPEAASYLREHAMRFFFEDSSFPQANEADDVFLEGVESSMRKGFLDADLALADECTVSTSSGSTVLTALVFGRHLLVANAGDCRAVLCRKGEAVEMSRDHRPGYEAERERVMVTGGFIDDGYLNGVLSVTRALGDWDMKFPMGSPSPLIAEPEFQQAVLTEDDEFLIIGCDGIWDVMSSQHAVGVVRRGLRRHDNPEQGARDLVMEALRLKTIDNLTVIVVCFSSDRDYSTPQPQHQQTQQQRPRLRCCSLSAEALCNLKSLLEENARD
ncbi:putative protein phosphatase 2C 2 [Acorus calamus]|uniref:protein-serine/threonine phosphatase n=1 Tax=Acorus calamus TaxID=4465 RepID=A0AAV9ETV3_ACOCL|nr:putative protein phosphatase 2C 2 [Acorus calamus]